VSHAAPPPFEGAVAVVCYRSGAGLCRAVLAGPALRFVFASAGFVGRRLPTSWAAPLINYKWVFQPMLSHSIERSVDLRQVVRIFDKNLLSASDLVVSDTVTPKSVTAR
jgi:hypothetical protein